MLFSVFKSHDVGGGGDLKIGPSDFVFAYNFFLFDAQTYAFSFFKSYKVGIRVISQNVGPYEYIFAYNYFQYVAQSRWNDVQTYAIFSFKSHNAGKATSQKEFYFAHNHKIAYNY